MGNHSANSIFPQSFKTAAVTGQPPQYTYQAVDPLQGVGSLSTLSYIGFQLYEPYNLYEVKALKTHFKCSFESGVSSTLQTISKISVGSSNGSQPSPNAPSLAVNYTPTGGVIEFTLDLATLLSPIGDNIIYLYFPAALAPGATGWSGLYNQIQIEVWKVDMLYQVVGVR